VLSWTGPKDFGFPRMIWILGHSELGNVSRSFLIELILCIHLSETRLRSDSVIDY
jgi:hypothetical protein